MHKIKTYILSYVTAIPQRLFFYGLVTSVMPLGVVEPLVAVASWEASWEALGHWRCALAGQVVGA
jgi:hypothetical protein